MDDFAPVKQGRWEWGKRVGGADEEEGGERDREGNVVVLGEKLNK